ncbi:G-D-S-L family lipolytic protein [Planktosalinus lacus]|uniref:Outer membrane protein n=1 Tax=Planktosalinus lacus TaxID=1526573 RepID=A0A8J2Y4X9_9FLAO|nr:G-D-S-L family lipolytic protein [Planktosalinus lacus]GGD81734.1 outer membrane protein [Planktosalinus lacus]
MKINSIKYKWLMLCVGALFVACESDDDSISTDDEPVVIVSGEADFSNYVSLGNSLTAGYTDGALFIAGQENSLPNILAGQFALAGGGEFNQPLMNDNLGGLLLGGNVITANRLFFNGAGPERVQGMPSTEITNTLSGSFNNMGVPGAKSFHLLAPGYGNVAGVATGQANPYFVRFASSANTTIINDAVAQQPSFFSLWIGNNDVLGYATSGGAGVNQAGNLDPSTYGGNDITDPNVFAQVYSGLVDALTASGAKGVVANIPNVMTIPYFNTVPYNPVPLDAATAGAVSQAYAAYNAGLLQAEAAQLISADERAERTISFSAGQNSVVIVDEYLTDLSGLGLPSYRQTTSDDLLVLTSSTFIGTTVNNNPQLINGVTVPLEDQWVLTTPEQEDVINATLAFNQVIETVANQKGLAFVDAYEILNAVAETGVAFDEYTMNASLVFGGAFSLDGVHPTARGYAFLANNFMEAINATYGSNLPAVKARDYITLYPASM